ncbi:sporulation histidine kinase inhibitor Sda [Pontibacillus litoralis]|uniref:Sporulation protein n=1 Tax=Pontibacillus litoralis JSM 072002 TaxID=1385512 RepID=A0A0A5GCN1_9BACI|nr:sporulation histidine kinase inhibitor Sda [Pontibacillus litoralis]KGX88948.1 sporulation protein [Pontibacillus litoralis JSM 072002]
MEHLSDELLIETYQKAIDLQLSSEFIQLIEEELQQRSITYQVKQPS